MTTSIFILVDFIFIFLGHSRLVIPESLQLLKAGNLVNSGRSEIRQHTSTKSRRMNLTALEPETKLIRK